MANATLIAPARVTPEARLAANTFLIRYTGGTRRLYEESLRLFFAWCAENDLDPMRDVRRSHIEAYTRHMVEVRGNTARTVQVRLAPVVGMYRLAEIDGAIDRSPATHIQRPRTFDDESPTVSLSMVELMLFIRTAERSPVLSDAALAHLMGGLGLRVSEACSIQIEDYQDVVRGHRVLRFVGKGSKPALLPLSNPHLRAFDRAADGRTEGPLLVRPQTGRRTAGLPFTRRATALAVTRLCREAGIERALTPHGLRHSFVTAGLDMGLTLRDMQIAARHSDPRTTSRYDHGRQSLDRHAAHVIAARLAS